MTEVRTRDEAIASVDTALGTWSTNLSGVLAQAQNAAQAARSEVEGIARERANQVAALEAQLSAAHDEQRPQLQSRLSLARDASDNARRAAVRVNDIAVGVSQLNQAHITTSTSQVASARAQLTAMSNALDSYRAVRTVSGAGGSASGRTIGRGGDSPRSTGLAELDVDSADLDENPIQDDHGSQGSYGKGGLSRADYRWAVQTWNDSVGPGVAGGKTREDFAELDAKSNAQPLRRKADVYDLFLGADRIRADRRPDGSLDIINGRHRLLIAKELGIKTLPGQVSQ